MVCLQLKDCTCCMACLSCFVEIGYFSNLTKHSGMAARLSNKYFRDDVALMMDILQELSFLSEALQARCVTLTRAEKLILRSIKAFKLLTESKGHLKRKLMTELLLKILTTSSLLKIINLVAILGKSCLR